MRLCIVIQSDAFRDSAGMRIRYDRFRDSLDPQIATIDAATAAELAASPKLEHDVYIFCKTFDTAALLLARRIRAAGKIVGQDLFDDYFSQTADPRLQRYRDWMRDMAAVTDFAICSTPRMAEVVRSYLPGVRVSVVEDPVVGFDATEAAALADEKVNQARASRVLRIVWFGIGDNPLFPVGLTDLAACEPEFAVMERLGWAVHLTIVTNMRAFEGTGAEALRQLSVSFDVVEWSEETEGQALAAAAIAIIPVNGQSFSRAKSLNRALTALRAGCQVLSTGYPLYDRLRPFIYRSTKEMTADIAKGAAYVRSQTARQLSRRIGSLADPTRAARAFADEALRAIQARRPARQETVCVLHGHHSSIAIHKAVGSIGGLSVKTIFCRAAWNFPVRFDLDGNEVIMRVTPQLAGKFALPLRDGAEVKRFGDFELVDVDHGKLGLRRVYLPAVHQSNPVLDLPVYRDVMRFAQEACHAAFPAADVIVSDSSPITHRPPRLSLPERPASRGASADRGRLPAPSETRAALRPRWPKLRLGGSGKTRPASLLAGSALFDGGWYLSRYPDVAVSGLDPIQHYLKFGWREGRDPGPSFSTRGYLKANKDVAQLGINPLVHYLEHGQVEGRKAPPAKKGATAQ
jgi:hypothetical protein